jgi:HSP20 family protein
MHEVNQALNQVKELYQKILGRPAPDLDPGSFVSFPPGVDPLNLAVHEVEHLRHLSEQVAMAPRPVAWIPPADCFASKDAYVIRLEVPGIDRKEIKVFIAAGEVLVRGERKRPEGLAGMQPLTVELSWGPFERRFPLPAGSLTEKVAAHFEEGLLEIRIPVEPREVPKETTVEVE